MLDLDCQYFVEDFSIYVHQSYRPVFFFVVLLPGFEVKNNLTIAGGGGTVGRGDYRNYYNGHMDKTKGEGGGGGGRGGQPGSGGGRGRKGTQL